MSHVSVESARTGSWSGSVVGGFGFVDYPAGIPQKQWVSQRHAVCCTVGYSVCFGRGFFFRFSFFCGVFRGFLASNFASSFLVSCYFGSFRLLVKNRAPSSQKSRISVESARTGS